MIKVSDLKVGSNIRLDGEKVEVTQIKSDPRPDRLLIEVRWAEGECTWHSFEKYELLEGAEDKGKLLMDSTLILTDMIAKLKKRLDYGVETYGAFWTGPNALDMLEEELLDALVYLWVARRSRK